MAFRNVFRGTSKEIARKVRLSSTSGMMQRLPNDRKDRIAASFHTSQPSKALVDLPVGLGLYALGEFQDLNRNYDIADFFKVAGVCFIGFFAYDSLFRKGKEYLDKSPIYNTLNTLGFDQVQSDAIMKITKCEQSPLYKKSDNLEEWRRYLTDSFDQIKKNIIYNNRYLNMTSISEKDNLIDYLKVFFPEVEKYEMNEACYRKFVLQLCDLFQEKNEQYLKREFSLTPKSPKL